MHTRPRRAVVLLILAVVLCLTASATRVLAQEALTAQVLPQGAVSVLDGERLLATLSLNAHGPDWKLADQAEAEATVEEVDGGQARVVEGLLAVPNTDGGALRFLQTLDLLPQGLSAEYILGPTAAISLNGLQVSLLLPAGVSAGRSVVVHTPAAEGADATSQTVALPAEQQAKWQLYTGPGSKIEIAPGTADAITLVTAPPTAQDDLTTPAPEIAIQDLRKWGRDQIEVRLFLMMEDDGRLLQPWDKLRIALSLSFARELRWQ